MTPHHTCPSRRQVGPVSSGHPITARRPPASVALIEPHLVDERESPWRRIAWSAGFVNDAGDWVLAVALPVFVFVQTRSGSATALLFVCQLAIGAILGPIGGSLVDRWDLRRCLVVTNLGQAVTLLPLLAVNGDRIWPAYPVIAVQAVLTQLNNPANVALVPRVVHPDQLTAANAALAASGSLARLIGSPLGGILVAWRGLAPVVVVDSISFLVVATSLRFLRTDTSPIAQPDGSARPHLREGLHIVRHHPPLAPLLSIHGLTQIAQGGFVVMFIAFIVQTLGDDGSDVGLIRGTMAIGALIGSTLIARLARRVDPTVLYPAGLIGMGVVSYAFWNAPEFTTALWAYMVLFALSGIPGSAMSVGLLTTLQTRSPSHAIGRVAGLLGTAGSLGTAVGSIITGLLIGRVSLRVLLNAQASFYLVGGLLAAIFVTTRQRRQRR